MKRRIETVKKLGKRNISMLLITCMLLTLIPVVVLANIPSDQNSVAVYEATDTIALDTLSKLRSDEISFEQRRELIDELHAIRTDVSATNELIGFEATSMGRASIAVANDSVAPEVTPREIENIFPDPVLAQEIAQMLGVGVNYIVEQRDLNEIYMIYRDWGQRITNLEGIQYLRNLIFLYAIGNENYYIEDLTPLSKASFNYLYEIYLYNNRIKNLSPLSEMSELLILDLNNNLIEDLTPLSGLGNLFWLWLENNQISDITPLRYILQFNHSWEGGQLINTWLRGNQVSDVTPFAGLFLRTDVSIEDQIITYPRLVNWNNPLTVSRIVRDVNGNLLGQYTWENLPANQRSVTFNWSTEMQGALGRFGRFSGTGTVHILPPGYTGIAEAPGDIRANVLQGTSLADVRARLGSTIDLTLTHGTTGDNEDRFTRTLPVMWEPIRPWNPNLIGVRQEFVGTILLSGNILNPLNITVRAFVTIVDEMEHEFVPSIWHTTVYYNGRLIVMGGYLNGEVLNIVQEINLATGEFRRFPSPMQTPRYGHTATLVGSNIFVVGGSDGESIVEPIHVFNITTETWTTMSLD